MNSSQPIIIYTDNQSCMKLVENEKFSNRTKHVDIKYHYIRNTVDQGRIELRYVPTDENIADMFTKPLGSIKIKLLRGRALLN